MLGETAYISYNLERLIRLIILALALFLLFSHIILPLFLFWCHYLWGSIVTEISNSTVNHRITWDTGKNNGLWVKRGKAPGSALTSYVTLPRQLIALGFRFFICKISTEHIPASGLCFVHLHLWSDIYGFSHPFPTTQQRTAFTLFQYLTPFLPNGYSYALLLAPSGSA